MALPLHVALFVLLSAALHAGWNAVVKSADDRLLTMTVIIGTNAILALVALPFVAPPAPGSWIYLLLSALIHIGYFAFLILAYRFGDLSQVYPVARGAAPLMIATGAAFAAGELLDPVEFAGLMLVSLAIASFAFARGLAGLRDARPFLLGLATAAFVSSYTITDGLGVRASDSPFGFIAWLYVVDGLPLLLFALATRPHRIAPYVRAHWRRDLAAGVMCATAYGLVIWALNFGPMAFVSALRETSVVFAVLIGSRTLGEPFGGRRLLAAAAVAAGIAIMNLG